MQMHNKLHEVQLRLKVSKKHRNDFQKYNYRTCEDILEAIKPLLPAGCFITLSDTIVLVGERYYLKSTATFHCEAGSVSADAYAREPLDKKGSDVSQISGGCSTYARRYALSGLFCIDSSEAEEELDAVDNSDKLGPVTEKEVETLKSMIKSSGTEEIKILDHYKIYSLQNMSRDMYSQTMANLEKKIAKILGK